MTTQDLPLMTILDPGPDVLPGAALSAIDDLAARHRAANGLLIRLVNLAGGQIENRMELLPDRVKDRIETAAQTALTMAYQIAARSHAAEPAQPSGIADRGHLALATLTGAIGGFGGLPTALAELPVTTTVILRAIQSIAQVHGFDLTDAAVRAECIQVFASGSPLGGDDGVNTSFLTAKITLTGATIQRLIAAAAPRFAAVLGQKLAAQAVPILGAVTGAGVNYAFAGYYQEMAHVRFGLLRLARSHDPQAIADAFRQAVGPARINRA